MSYELYLIRHGVAEDRGDAWPDDSKRPLTSRGMSRVRKEARGLSRLGVSFDVVLTSPLVRARQTAEIIVAAVEPRPHLVNAESLAPGATFQALVTDIEKQGKKTRVALVGHEPGMGELAARLIGARRAIELKKGSVARIDLESIAAGAGTLRWLIPPRALRMVKK